MKYKYGSGYMLEIKITSAADVETLEQKMLHLHGYIQKLFPSAQVMEQFGERVQYKILKSDVGSLSKTFTVLEQGKQFFW